MSAPALAHEFKKVMLFGYFFKVLTAGVEWTSCIPCVKQVDFFDVKALFEKIRSRVERGSRGGTERACVGFMVDSRARVDVLRCHFFLSRRSTYFQNAVLVAMLTNPVKPKPSNYHTLQPFHVLIVLPLALGPAAPI